MLVRADRAAWSWLLSRIWATHVATGRAWLRALCRPALVAFVALFALTLPTAHLHGPSDAQHHIAVHWHGLPLLDAVPGSRTAPYSSTRAYACWSAGAGGFGRSRGWPGYRCGVGAAADKPLARDECRFAIAHLLAQRLAAAAARACHAGLCVDYRRLPATGCPDSPSRDSPARTPDDRIRTPVCR